MPVISVVTAALPNAHNYLQEAYESLAAQELPDGWTWEWVLQEDGDTGQLRSELSADALADPRVTLGGNEPSGPGMTRNLALTRATGELIRVLDSDDLLTPQALAREVTILDLYADVGWTTCQVLDLHPGGSTTTFHDDPVGGRLERQFVSNYWLEHHLSPVHPASMCVRRGLLLAVGGWMALPTGEDTGLLVALSEYSDGWFIDTPGLLYRQHEKQITKSDLHRDPDRQELRWKIITERINSIRQLGLGGFHQ